MTLDLGTLAQVVSTFTVVAGFAFATYQTLNIRRQRREEVALTLMRTTAPPETFTRIIRRLAELPDDAPPEAIHGLGAEAEQAIVQAAVNYENLGYLVYRRAIPLGLVDELIGGVVRLTWRKIRVWNASLRVGGFVNSFEWFEWLYDRLERYGHPAKPAGAHVRYRDWKP